MVESLSSKSDYSEGPSLVLPLCPARQVPRHESTNLEFLFLLLPRILCSDEDRWPTYYRMCHLAKNLILFLAGSPKHQFLLKAGSPSSPKPQLNPAPMYSHNVPCRLCHSEVIICCNCLAPSLSLRGCELLEEQSDPLSPSSQHVPMCPYCWVEGQ